MKLVLDYKKVQLFTIVGPRNNENPDQRILEAHISPKAMRNYLETVPTTLFVYGICDFGLKKLVLNPQLNSAWLLGIFKAELGLHGIEIGKEIKVVHK